MNAQRLWLIGTAIVAVGVLVLGWFVGVSPQLAAMSATDQQRAGVDAQNAATEATVARLADDFDGLDALEAERDELRQSIPVTHNKSLFVDQVDALAAASGTTVTQLSTASLVAYEPPAVEQPPTDAETPEAEEGAEGGDEPLPQPEVPSGPPVITDPAVTAENFYAIQVTVVVSGSDDGVLEFVDELQHGERLCLVTQLQIASDEETGLFTATSTGYVYVLIDADGGDADGGGTDGGGAEGGGAEGDDSATSGG
jgi:Tfp pilus assembly protein PilO